MGSMAIHLSARDADRRGQIFIQLMARPEEMTPAAHAQLAELEAAAVYQMFAETLSADTWQTFCAIVSRGGGDECPT